MTRKGPLFAILATGLGVAVAAVIVIAGLYATAPRATRVQVGDIAPDFELPVVTGGPPVRLSGNRGGPQLLVFVDTRRQGNEAYFRHLDLIRGRYFRRGLSITAVAIDPDPATARELVRTTGVTFAVLSDPFAAKLVSSYGTPRDPESYLLDPSGRVEAVFVERVDWNIPTFSEMLTKHLEPERPGR
jgi:cytochrome c biogenesis protein CcmG, thiol:disulfide interchange protein DsbE